MIGNQILAPSADKTTPLAGKNGAEGKADPEKPEGGLFRLMMNAVNGDASGGKGAKNGSGDPGNILGGNLTLNRKDSDDESTKTDSSALLRLFAGGEGTPDGVVEKSAENGETSSENDSSDSKKDLQVSGETDEKAETSSETKKSEDSDSDDEKTAAEDQPEVVSEHSEASAEQSEGGNGASVSNAEGDESDSQQDAASEANTVKAGSEGDDTGEKSGRDRVMNGTAGEASENGTGGKTEGETLSPDELKVQDGGSGDNGTIVENGTAENGDKDIRNGSQTNPKENEKERGLVNELRALAAARGEQPFSAPAEQNRQEPASEEAELPDENKVLEEMFQALQNGSIEQAAAEIRSLRASQLRENRYNNYLASFANRADSSGGQGMSLASGEMASGNGSSAGVQMLHSMPVMELMPVSGSEMTDMLDDSSSALWKEHLAEYFESNEKSASENQAAAAFARLGDVPVTNISVRRGFAQGISQGIMTSTANGKANGEAWQRHNFVLEDGKNIQVSARQVEGVLQLKLSSSYTELNKLLMEHQDEIRELLENEVELKIDLQFDGNGDGQLADFFGGSSGKEGRSSDREFGASGLKTKEQEVEKVVPVAVRKFGYNQMEWTI